jgi:hypothetical protein
MGIDDTGGLVEDTVVDKCCLCPPLVLRFFVAVEVALASSLTAATFIFALLIDGPVSETVARVEHIAGSRLSRSAPRQI